ncbi:Replication initiation protein [Xenorhabdus bovienii str. Jollieti]|uniref:Replication initiation protein n=2 Tax=Xenorhabdus bovienii TaxID=40576 RepID=D3V775_XENBS|nr:Replication initiation protein [Xenorhabdus bovienii SS-2004]CDH29237.1 Replication initiation protein [Xenorhabdus bovienii str. Jollieti]
MQVSRRQFFKICAGGMAGTTVTEHETKLILCCVALLNPSLENPTEEQRTVTFTYQEYAKMMGLTLDNAYHRLTNATRELMSRTVQILYPTGDIDREIFQWVNYAKFNRKTQSVTLTFSPHIQPFLFQLKRFIKYNLEHVKAFENKYSMRVYEWLLKEITQRKVYKANIEISIDKFKFMLMLDKQYTDLRNFTTRILNTVTKDLNTYSNMKLEIKKRGRPADTLIFQVELDRQIDLITELDKGSVATSKKATKPTNSTPEAHLHGGLRKTLHDALTAKIQLTGFEAKFLGDMQSKYDLNGSFSWLTQKQRTTLENILAKYGRI